jgi:type-F conjugative transfer system pilin assembly protein TrbC
MAQKELLFPMIARLMLRRAWQVIKLLAKRALLIMGFVCGILTSGNITASPVNISKEDYSWAWKLATEAKALAISAASEKYIQLQRMTRKIPGNITDDEIAARLLTPAPILRVFVSTSMNNELLKRYVNDAKIYGAVLVFKGLPDGSWRALSRLITEIAGDDDRVAIQIDDEAFAHFGINSVPSFILSHEEGRWQGDQRPEIHDKVLGNIGIRGALRLIAEEGELAAIASKILKQGGSRG